jgi:hypothetical protein
MTKSIEWFDEEQSIAFYRIEGHWTIDHMIEQLQAYVALGNQQPIYYIIDMSKANMIPNGFLVRRADYEHLLRLSQGLTVLVRPSHLVTMILRLVKRFDTKLHDITFADSVEQAAEAIAEHRKSYHTS